MSIQFCILLFHVILHTFVFFKSLELFVLNILNGYYLSFLTNSPITGLQVVSSFLIILNNSAMNIFVPKILNTFWIISSVGLPEIE